VACSPAGKAWGGKQAGRECDWPYPRLIGGGGSAGEVTGERRRRSRSGAVGAAWPWRAQRMAPREWGREAVRHKGVHSARTGGPRPASACGTAVTGGRARRRERTESRRVLVPPQGKVALFDRVFLTILTHK
jgi:hypothetical protein